MVLVIKDRKRVADIFGKDEVTLGELMAKYTDGDEAKKSGIREACKLYHAAEGKPVQFRKVDVVIFNVRQALHNRDFVISLKDED